MPNGEPGFPIDAKGFALRETIAKATEELNRAQWHLAGSITDGDEESRAAKLAIQYVIDYLTDALGMKVER